MCKISLLNGSIITIIISKQKTTAERTKQPIRRWRQHLGNIITFKKQTQTNKKKNPHSKYNLALSPHSVFTDEIQIGNTWLSSVSGNLHPISEQINDCIKQRKLTH